RRDTRSYGDWSSDVCSSDLKRLGRVPAVEDVSFEISTGSLIALLGPSGSGKSTLLRMIAGLEIPDSGQIHITGEESTSRTARERSDERRVGNECAGGRLVNG